MVAYNSNQGMNPVKSLSDKSYSANLMWFPIASGYANNIFTGSPVTLTSGLVTNGVTTAWLTDLPILGSARSFKDFTTGGTGIVAPSANQGVVPTTIQQYWVGGTVKPTGVQTYVGIQMDADTLYDMQANSTLATGFLQSASLTGFSFAPTNGFRSVDGNTSTGYSTTRLVVGAGSGASNMQLINLSPNIGNAWGVALNNGLFKINNSTVYAAKSI